MEYELPMNLEGSEFLTTYFYPDIGQGQVMILALGENTKMEREGGAVVYLYLFIDGVFEHGIDSFVFFKMEEIQDFLTKLPRMSAFDFILAGCGIQPRRI